MSFTTGRGRRLLATVRVALVVAVTGFAIGIPVAAHAAAFQVVCTGTQTTTFTPGLTNTPQTVVRAGQNIHSPCVATVAPFSFSGSTSFTSTATLSCSSLLSANTGADLITWSTGATSTFTYNRTVTTVGGQTIVTLTGSITAGWFTGATAIETITSPALDLTACATPEGITSTFGVSELTITGS